MKFEIQTNKQTGGAHTHYRDANSKIWRRSASPNGLRSEVRNTSSSSNSGASLSDQYPSRTSYQDSATAFIDAYRPTPAIDSYRPSLVPSRPEPGNQRVSSSHPADNRQKSEKHPAETLREHGRIRNGREPGRLSPIRDTETESRISTIGLKREREDGPDAGENVQVILRPQAKRPRATDFVDMGEDHYP